ncbi:hypothetical protein Hanom_Chr17g01563011 [Helianthus anomalus]
MDGDSSTIGFPNKLLLIPTTISNIQSPIFPIRFRLRFDVIEFDCFSSFDLIQLITTHSNIK